MKFRRSRNDDTVGVAKDDLGLQFFVGYKDTFNVRGEREPFINSAMAGLNSFLNGDSVATAKEKMLNIYDEQIASLDVNSWERKFLVHNKEALVFEYENDICLVDLVVLTDKFVHILVVAAPLRILQRNTVIIAEAPMEWAKSAVRPLYCSTRTRESSL